MSGEQRLREVLAGAAADPGPKEEWPAFLKTARRHRLVHRARIGGGVALLVLAGVAGTTLMDRLPDRERPRPAEKKEKRLDRDLRRGEVAELEERLRESQKLVEDAGLVPGPSRVVLEGTRRPGPDGAEPEARADPEAPPASVQEDPTTALCRGKAATVVGTPGRDVLEGSPGPDVIAGLGGDDTIRAGGGDDVVCGGDGIDHLFGDAGKDSLVGDGGDDALNGGPGYDFLHFPGAAQGVDVDFANHSAAGEGDDVVREVEAAEGTPFGDGFTGDDGSNLFWGDAGGDYFNGGGGGDYIWPGPGDDYVSADDGIDTVGFHYAGGSGDRGVDVDLAAGRAVGEGVDTLAGVENVYGTAADDFVSGTAGPNALHGGFGDDTVSGGAGDDVVTGGEGADTLDGGPGHDTVDGGGGEDACTAAEERTSCETGDPISAAGAAVAAGAALAALRRRRKV